MNLKSLKVRKVTVLGTTGNVVLHFAGFPESVVSIKPLSILTLGMEAQERAIVNARPSTLVGSTLTVTDNTIDNVTTKGEIISFKAGDKYIADENNTKVIEGTAKAGDELSCEKDGIKINGRMEFTLPKETTNKIEDLVFAHAIAASMVAVPKAQPSNAKVAVEETNDVFSSEEIAQ